MSWLCRPSSVIKLLLLLCFVTGKLFLLSSLCSSSKLSPLKMASTSPRHPLSPPSFPFLNFFHFLSLMKAGFEVVNHGALDTIQPHEPWDYATAAFPTPPFELSELVEQITKQLVDDLPETAGSADILPSLSGDFRPRKATRRNYFDTVAAGNDQLQWSNINNEARVNVNSDHGRNRGLSRVDEHGLTLITLLLECAVAVSVDNLGEAHRMLLELTQMGSPYGLSCAERAVAYFAKAMSSRVINSWLGTDKLLFILKFKVDHKKKLMNLIV